MQLNQKKNKFFLELRNIKLKFICQLAYERNKKYPLIVSTLINEESYANSKKDF